ncbi:nucleotidyltransferase domain-containing protein [Bacillus cereus]|uniref:Polymerase nucleotidyl transferase domain-containing protein n=1 Tax=Bacillus cereus HuA2-1 TaxID=1053201 RepID=J9BJE7_BACCE|nr:nucleotidyltransferase domain-containing protein [Bacillus cereus]EJV74120.1 hypothetical protein IG3_05942 [Bacillus cereus HuA2-1]
MSSIHLSSISFELDKKKLIELINCNQDDVIFISGSLVEGIGNEKSDLDIFVLVDDFENLNSNFDYNFNEVKLKFEKLNSLGCDIEFWPLKVVIELIEQINKIDFENPNLRSLNQIKITNYEFRKLSSFIHRFLVSECVFNDEKYNKLKDKINVPKFCRLMTRYNVNMVDNLYEDIIGNLEKKEDETAVIISKDFLMKTITAYLFSNLYTLDREKWIYIKLKILAENYIEAKGVLDDFQNLYFQRTFSAPNEARDLVEDIIYFSNDIVSKIENKLGGI